MKQNSTDGLCRNTISEVIMEKKEKRYPFSAAKHAHDIEFYHNRLFNSMREMECGDAPWDDKKYDWMEEMYDKVEEIRNEMFGCPPVVYLTGKQIGLAKQIVAWASNERARICIKNGRYDLVQYC